MNKLRHAIGFLLAVAALAGHAEEPVIDFVHMGDDDCPPCMYWRAMELPQLRKLPEFARLRFTHVRKSIRSTVPPASAFPPEIRHLQPALAEAANGAVGSPQQALLVDGKVVDYWIGIGAGKGDAPHIAAFVRTILAHEPPPRATCTKLATQGSCLVAGR